MALIPGKGVQIPGYWCYYQLFCQSLAVAYSCPLILLDSSELKPTTILSAGKDPEIWQSQCQDKERVQKCPRNGGLSRLAINLNAEGGIDPTSPRRQLLLSIAAGWIHVLIIADPFSWPLYGRSRTQTTYLARHYGSTTWEYGADMSRMVQISRTTIGRWVVPWAINSRNRPWPLSDNNTEPRLPWVSQDSSE